MRPEKDDRYEKLGELLRQLPTPTLDKRFDERFWERFEREKDNLPPAPFMTPPRMAAAGLAAVALAAMLTLAAGRFVFTADKPGVTLAQGQALVSHDGGPDQNLEPAYRLKPGDVVKTEQAGWLLLEMENGYRVKLHPDSEMRVVTLKRKGLPQKSVFHLAKGQVLVSIGDGAHKKYPLEIRTPNAFARAMGTQFMVSLPSQGAAQSQISVLEGTVHAGSRVNGRSVLDSSVFVPQGQETFVAGHSAPLPAQAMLEKDHRVLEEMFQFGKRNRVILLIGMSRQRVRELLKPCGLYIKIDAENPVRARLVKIANTIQKASEDEDIDAHLLAADKLEQAIHDQTDLDRVPVLLFLGAYYTYLKQPEESLRLFEKVSLEYPDSHFNSLALLAAATVLEEGLGSPGKALPLLREIVSKHPDSYEAAEAAAGIARIEALPNNLP